MWAAPDLRPRCSGRRSATLGGRAWSLAHSGDLATHYHQVDVGEQQEATARSPHSTVNDMLAIPVVTDRVYDVSEIISSLENTPRHSGPRRPLGGPEHRVLQDARHPQRRLDRGIGRHLDLLAAHRQLAPPRRRRPQSGHVYDRHMAVKLDGQNAGDLRTHRWHPAFGNWSPSSPHTTSSSSTDKSNLLATSSRSCTSGAESRDRGQTAVTTINLAQAPAMISAAT